MCGYVVEMSCRKQTQMSVTGCQQKILLNQAYYNVFPIAVQPSSAKTIDEAILYSFFVLNQWYGVTVDELTAYMAGQFPEYATEDVLVAFGDMLVDGWFIVVQPYCRDWCSSVCPPTRYVIPARVAQNSLHDSLVLFLVQLAGGTRVKTKAFSRWFVSWTNPTPLQSNGPSSSIFSNASFLPSSTATVT